MILRGEREAQISTAHPFFRKCITYLQQFAAHVGAVFHVETGYTIIVQVQVVAQLCGSQSGTGHIDSGRYRQIHQADTYKSRNA